MIGAIIRTGGKQYIVKIGDVLDIEKIAGDAENQVIFDEVLAKFSESGEVELGAPILTNAKVEAKVLHQHKGDKIEIFKMKRRKRYRRLTGHRQLLTQVEITKI